MTRSGAAGALVAALEALLTERSESEPWLDVSKPSAADPSLCAVVPVPRRTIRDEVRRGKLRAARVAHRLLVKQSELDRWLETYTVKPKAKVPASTKLIDKLGARRKAANE